jgi:hypothetical protein
LRGEREEEQGSKKDCSLNVCAGQNEIGERAKRNPRKKCTLPIVEGKWSDDREWIEVPGILIYP